LNGNCAGHVIRYKVTVLPNSTQLSINPINNQQLCHYEMTNAVTFSGSVPNTVYSWTNSDPSIGLAASGTGDIQSFRAINNGLGNKTATITVTANYVMNGVICSGNAAIFTITVDTIPVLPVILDTTYCGGSTVPTRTLPSSYTWKQTGDNVGLNTTSDTGDIPQFTATNNTTSPKTATFEIVPTNGNCQGTKVTYSLTVLPNAQLTINPIANQQVCHGSSTNAVTFSGNVPNTVYTWTNSDPSIGLAASGNGNIASFTVTNSGSSNKTATIMVTPEYTLNGLTCANNGAAASFTIIVDTIPVLSAILDSTYCGGSTVPTRTLPSSYTWKQTGDNVGLGTLSGTGNIPQFTATNGTTSPKTATFEITPTNGSCQGSAVMYSITVLPNAQLTINPIANQQLCHGETTNAVMFSGNVSNAIYRWTNSDPTIGLAASGVGNIAAFTAINSGSGTKTATITVTPEYTLNGLTCANSSAAVPFTIIVGNIPTMPQAVSDTVYCNGEIVPALTLPNTFTWKQTGDNIGAGALSGTGSIPSFVAANNRAYPITATFEIVPDNGICKGAAVQYTVTVNPQMDLISDADMGFICSNTRFNYIARSNVSNVTFNWTRAAHPDINNGAVGKGTGAVIDEILYNRSSNTVAVIYTIEMSYNGCSNSTSTVRVQVNPIPSIDISSVVNACQGDATATLMYAWTSNKTLGNTYDLTFDANALLHGFTNISNASFPLDSLTIALPNFLPLGNYGASLTLTSDLGCVNTTAYSLYIQVNENTRITKQPEPVTLCNDDGFTLSVTATGRYLTYQWYRNGVPIAGATASSYTVIQSDSTTDYGIYYVEVSGLCGMEQSDAVEVIAGGLQVLSKWTDVAFVSNAGKPFVAYQWYRDGKPIGQDGNYQSYVEKGGLDGTYYVVVTYADGTKETSCPRTFVRPSQLSLSVYPNPVRPYGEITIDMRNYPLSEVEGSRFEIIDMLGQTLTVSTIKTPLQRVQVNLSTGIYMYRITTKSNEVVVGKILVH